MRPSTTPNTLRWFVAAILALANTRGLFAAEPRSADANGGAGSVILLTGFEPFGADRNKNASWEGVKSLDGRKFHEFTLASRQMRVVWGAPLEQLQAWVAESKPVAIFSFGQGGGDFRVESRAANNRGAAPDNNGVRPLKSETVAGGPAEYLATSDCQKFATELAAKGYPVELGTNAGRYLCEECLYSLEHLKANHAAPAGVLFCHVPQLGTQIDGRPVDGPYIERFVNDVLEVWYASYQKAAPGEDAAGKEKQAAVEQVRAFVDRYFATWSKQDMAGYGDCFAPQASIQFIDSDGRVVTRNKAQFVAEQTEYHARARVRAEEKPVDVDIRVEARLARAVVFWKLTAGPRTEFGYDHFTLIRDNGRWRILNLAFYASDRVE
jgi:pyrrolidone-carboxylate peptidase